MLSMRFAIVWSVAVLVSCTPYSTERFPDAYEAAVYFAQRGYVERPSHILLPVIPPR